MNFTMAGLNEMLLWHGVTPKFYVETGTMYGAGARLVAQVFDDVSTIELSYEMANEARLRLSGHNNVTVYCGDSRDILPLVSVPEPTVFYLDAHGCKEINTAGQGESPLFDELKYISSRGCNDLVIVDDVHAFGGGADGPNPFWARTTTETITAVLGTWVKKTHIFGDQFAVSCG